MPSTLPFTNVRLGISKEIRMLEAIVDVAMVVCIFFLAIGVRSLKEKISTRPVARTRKMLKNGEVLIQRGADGKIFVRWAGRPPSDVIISAVALLDDTQELVIEEDVLEEEDAAPQGLTGGVAG